MVFSHSEKPFYTGAGVKKVTSHTPSGSLPRQAFRGGKAWRTLALPFAAGALEFGGNYVAMKVRPRGLAISRLFVADT